MTSHLDSHGQVILNQKCYQVSKPEMELHMINTIYAALPMHTETKKTTFSCYDDYCKAVHIYWSGDRDLYIDEAHTALDIFRFAAFLVSIPSKSCNVIIPLFIVLNKL